MPAFDTAINTNRDIALLADHTAEASLLIACGQVSESIGKIVELALFKHVLWHVILEPESLWDLHLDGHLTTDITQQVMLGGIDLCRFLDGAMIEPQNDIAVTVEIRAGNRDRLVCILGEDGQGASSIKSDTLDRMGIDVVLAERSLDGYTDTAPDICS